MSQAPVIPLFPGRPPPETLQVRSDDELMHLAAAGVIAAFEELVRRHQRPLRAFCARMLGDGARADDAAQEVLLEVWRTCARYQSQGRFRSFLLTCARRRCWKATRERRETAVAAPPLETPDADLLDALLAAERRRHLDRAMERLPAKLREAVALRFAGGLDYQEIAAVTGRGEATMRTRVFLGLKRLRALLGGAGRERIGT